MRSEPWAPKFGRRVGRGRRADICDASCLAPERADAPDTAEVCVERVLNERVPSMRENSSISEFFFSVEQFCPESVYDPSQRNKELQHLFCYRFQVQARLCSTCPMGVVANGSTVLAEAGGSLAAWICVFAPAAGADANCFLPASSSGSGNSNSNRLTLYLFTRNWLLDQLWAILPILGRFRPVSADNSSMRGCLAFGGGRWHGAPRPIPESLMLKQVGYIFPPPGVRPQRRHHVDVRVVQRGLHYPEVGHLRLAAAHGETVVPRAYGVARVLPRPVCRPPHQRQDAAADPGAERHPPHFP